MTIEEQRARLLAWEGSFNSRDLGGYPTAGGRETRWGAVVRADNLGRLTDTGQAALADYGVRTIVDLRLPRELEEHPNPFAEPGEHGIAYVNISFVDPAAQPLEGEMTLADEYKYMLDTYRSAVAAVMTAIAEAKVGGVLIHCMAGKDRTGIISALLLALAGVPRQVVAEDYALSGENLRPVEQQWIETGPGDRAERERIVARYTPTVEGMTEVLAYLDERYGGVEAYLREAGVAPDDIARLRDRLVA
jgi:protein-tyrosine phosphatase